MYSSVYMSILISQFIPPQPKAILDLPHPTSPSLSPIMAPFLLPWSSSSYLIIPVKWKREHLGMFGGMASRTNKHIYYLSLSGIANRMGGFWNKINRYFIGKMSKGLNVWLPLWSKLLRYFYVVLLPSSRDMLKNNYSLNDYSDGSCTGLSTISGWLCWSLSRTQVSKTTAQQQSNN